MRPFIFCVINFLCQIGCAYGQYLSAHYKCTLNDCTISGNILLETTASSLSSCCSHCAKDSRCLAVSYKRTGGTCITHDVCPAECSIFGPTDPGWSLLCLERPMKKPASCSEIQRSDNSSPDGIYTIYPNGEEGVQAYCDMTTEGGGWTVFQRRLDGSVDFYRGWEDYKNGFGDPTGEFWLGNDALHELIMNGTCKLRIDMVTLTDETGYAAYSNFTIGSEQEGYALNFTHYLGTVGDALSYHKGQKFTTIDKDNDKYNSRNCAVTCHGAWWYNKCQHSNLNAMYGGSDFKSMRWYNWKTQSADGFMKKTKMMVQCGLG